ncbi:MAG: hypothetical protein KAY46_10450 [Burkholderiaceae bacterium]|nr:hypothetical protein [Burkholderiaceae bacterium]
MLSLRPPVIFLRWRGSLVGLLAMFVLCVQSLAGVLPALGQAHHHEPDPWHSLQHSVRHERLAAPAHSHIAVERHHHRSPADEDDSVAHDEAIDQLLEDLMQRLGNVTTALSGEPCAGHGAAAFAPVRVALPGSRLRGRPPDLPYRPPIA